MQFIDGAIVLVGMYVFGVQKALYAIIAVFLVTKVSDSMIEGLKFSKQAYIITSKPQEISSEIMEKLDRGVTGIHGKGMYSGSGQAAALLCSWPQGDRCIKGIGGFH